MASNIKIEVVPGKPGVNGSSAGPKPARADRVSLSIPEVFSLSVAVADRRGMPRESHAFFGQQIVWLEQRGLPAFTAMLDDVLKHKDRPWNERTPQKTGTGQYRFDCPFISGMMLEKEFDDLVVAAPGKWGRIAGPSVPFLLLSRIAGYAERIGQPIHVGWLKGTPPKIEAETVVDGDRLASIGDGDAMLHAEGIAFRRLDGDMPRQATGAERDSISISKAALTALSLYLGDSEDQADPVTAFGRDNKTIALLKELSSADLSNLSFVARSRIGDTEGETSKVSALPEDIVLKTGADTANFRLFSHLVDMGWMEPRESNDSSGDPSLNSRNFGWTEKGKRLLPQLYYFYMDRHFPENQGQSAT